MSKRKGMQFDSRSLSLGQVTHQVWTVLRDVLYVFGAGVFITLLIYCVFALFFSTDTEKRLARENRAYEHSYSIMKSNQIILRDALTSLQYKDAEVYDHTFHSQAPNVDPMGKLDFLFAGDTIPVSNLAGYTYDKAELLQERTVRVDSVFDAIFTVLARSDSAVPPMTMPLEDISYPQVGAATGSRYSPFYKAFVEHGGLDFIVISGTPVYASADGVVTSGTGSSKMQGKTVELQHEGGYVTRYSHLETILVGRGQKVTRGQKIGTVGMTGRSYAPHLHYEVLKNGKTCNPVNYLFGSVSPQDYANILYMSAKTKQSMD